MTKTKAILLGAFLLVFAAGAALGVLIGRSGRPRERAGWLTAELNLTDPQREQMHQVWSEVMGAGFREQGQQRAAMAQDRDRAIAALLSESQRSQYEAIQQNHLRRVEELSQERRRAFENAVERTKGILTPDQARKYEEWMKRQGERGMGGPGGFRGPRRYHTATASGPTTRPMPAPRGEEQLSPRR